MKYEYAISILQKEYSEFINALEKSADCVENNNITLEEHMKHLANVSPKIKELCDAISILKAYRK